MLLNHIIQSLLVYSESYNDLHYLVLGSLMAQLVKNHLQCGRSGFDLWIGKIPGRRERQPTPILWPRAFHGLYSPCTCKESDTTE